MQHIYTIGHSTRTAEQFVAMLQSFGVQLLADVRTMLGSKWQPQYNQHALAKVLRESVIEYRHFPQLGGKKQSAPGIEHSIPVGVHGYAAYMESAVFSKAIAELATAAKQQTTAYMCAEASWRNCHRAYISDYLQRSGWSVLHITDVDKKEPHVLRPCQVQGELF